MVHPFLQAQLSAFTHSRGKITEENIDDFLSIISSSYYNYEMQEGFKENRLQTPDSVNFQQVHNTFETIREMVFAVDMQKYQLIFITPACTAVYGYTPDDFFANPNLWFEAIVDEDKERIHNNYAILVRGETLIQSYRIRHKNGAMRWLEARMEPTLDSNGQLARLDGVAFDITDRKEAEIALANNEKKFRSLIENSSDGITMTNKNLEFVFTSTALCRMSGFSLKELLNRPAYEFFHPDEADGIKEIVDTMLANPGKPVGFLKRFRKKDGGWFWAEGYVTNMLDEPAVEGVVTNFRDVTDRINKENELGKSYEALKKSNDELDRFVYSVSHDLRAPLASVLGALEYTMSEVTDEDILDNLNMMKASVMKLDVFILDILDYSRNARMEIKKQEVNFTELLTDLKTNLKFLTAGNSMVDIRTHVENGHAFASDKSRISIILNNLISNSIRYYNPQAQQPYVAVDVKVEPTCATITVKDNGIGIDKKYHEKIFDMFFRASNKSNGSGLGLYIVKEALEKLHASMAFESEPGQGTEFKINIPNLNTLNNN